MKAILILTSLCLLTRSSEILGQGVRLKSGVEFAQTEADSAYIDALLNYNGDLLIYFFRPESENHEAFVSNALNNDTLSEFVNANFARIAIDTSTDEGRGFLKAMRPDAPGWDFILLRRADGTFRDMHGWENIGGRGSSAKLWVEAMADFKKKVLPVPIAEMYAADTARTYTRVTVESAGEGHEIGFTGRVFDPSGTFSVQMAGTTPFSRKFVTDELVGLFQNLDPESRMSVSIESVKDGFVERWANGNWDVTMVIRRGDRLSTTGL